ncbi:hypothetical protein ACOTHJ_13185 [Achromobacter xylosoxidans]|uniref:hypothetical protein n=1 Tax=Achromobacter anxifer TaxID=1287737 RepID=UPI00155B63DD|nr:hypothetical protein [Achromobacter anxifer]CAB5514646.1 hypothetical protein LMG26857_03705 [Achromobacter anxifer]
MGNGDNAKKHASGEGKDLTGAYAAIILVALAFGIYYLIAKEGQQQEIFDRVLDAYVVDYQCVVAQMEGRSVKTYRCDRPTPGSYIAAADLYEAIRTGIKAK